MKQNFPKTEVVTGETPFFVIARFCTDNSIYLNVLTLIKLGFLSVVFSGEDQFVRKYVTYDNIKSHKKPGLHHLSRRCIFRKATRGGDQIDPQP